MRMSETLQTVMILDAPLSRGLQKAITERLDKIGMWWDAEKAVIPDLTPEQLMIVEALMDEFEFSYSVGDTTDGH
jgi:hypothetical protein